MKKKNRKAQAAKTKQRKTAPATAEAPRMDRRDMLRVARNGAIVAAGLGVAGYFSVGAVRATMAEYDLTRVGQGKPTLVQIHDPNCGQCRDLQREARKALKAVGLDRMDYVVANIRTAEGSAFAARHGVPHVTLMLLDGTGAVQNVLTGPNYAATLEAAFAEHLQEHGS